jgi:hypothetical protein
MRIPSGFIARRSVQSSALVESLHFANFFSPIRLVAETDADSAHHSGTPPRRHRQGRHEIRYTPIFQSQSRALDFRDGRPAQKIEQNLHALAGRHQPHDNPAKTQKRSLRHRDLDTRPQRFLDIHRFFRFETLAQFIDHRVGDDGNAIAEMHQAADAAHMADFIKTLIKIAPHEKITGEKRLDDAHNPAAGWPFESQPGMKHFQAEISVEIGRRDVLVLGLRPHAIPCGFLKRLDIR